MSINVCPFTMIRGARKGEECGKSCKDVYCSKHKKYNILPDYPLEFYTCIDYSLLDIEPPKGAYTTYSDDCGKYQWVVDMLDKLMPPSGKSDIYVVNEFRKYTRLYYRYYNDGELNEQCDCEEFRQGCYFCSEENGDCGGPHWNEDGCECINPRCYCDEDSDNEDNEDECHCYDRDDENIFNEWNVQEKEDMINDFIEERILEYGYLEELEDAYESYLTKETLENLKDIKTNDFNTNIVLQIMTNHFESL